MPRNQKLTKVIAGRTIKAVTTEPGSVLVLFDDQSSMKIKTTGAVAVSLGSKVKSVDEAKAELTIDFEDGSSAKFCLTAPGSSVAVRDKNNAVEYLGCVSHPKADLGFLVRSTHVSGNRSRVGVRPRQSR